MLIARGTGAALEAGKRGDADVLLVHAKCDELRLVEEGFFTDRRDVMFNDFIILGPEADPVGAGRAGSAAKALKMIADARAVFVSRGDNSGTHKKELDIWRAAGMKPEGPWYLEVGQGMAKAMRIASETPCTSECSLTETALSLTSTASWP
jgi:tungstate transport system substrate-binding protein